MGDEAQVWRNPPGGGFLSLPARRRTLTSLPRETSGKEWPLMRNLSSFMQRKSSTKALGTTASGPPQLKYKSNNKSKGKEKPSSINMAVNARIAAEERAADLEREIGAVKRAAGEEISGLELKVASRDAVLRRRAVHMAETAERIAQLEEQLAAAIAREAAIAAETQHIKEEFEGKEKALEMEIDNIRSSEQFKWMAREKEIIKHFQIQAQQAEKIHRPRPVRGFVKSLVIAGTGAAAVTLASSGNTS